MAYVASADENEDRFDRADEWIDNALVVESPGGVGPIAREFPEETEEGQIDLNNVEEYIAALNAIDLVLSESIESSSGNMFTSNIYSVSRNVLDDLLKYIFPSFFAGVSLILGALSISFYVSGQYIMFGAFVFGFIVVLVFSVGLFFLEIKKSKSRWA